MTETNVSSIVSYITLVLCTIVIAEGYITLERVDDQEMIHKFNGFVLKHDKTYHSKKEADKAFQNFKENYEKAVRMNEQILEREPHADAVFGVTKFSDLSTKEFAAKYLMKPNQLASARPDQMSDDAGDVSSLPVEYDWRDKGVVTSVNDQGQCGSCWAFSAAEEVESQSRISGQNISKLSTQQILDCDTNDDACSGGDTVSAYEYIIMTNGLELDSDYQYQEEKDSCQFKRELVKATISGYRFATNMSEDTLQQNLYKKGPISICVNAFPWQLYVSGVFNDVCANSLADLDHCVLLVGWGVDGGQGQYPFYSIRNSWGTGWGEAGYIRLVRGDNRCGYLDHATYVII